MWLLALALARLVLLVLALLPPLPPLGLLWRPGGSAGLFLCGGLLSGWVPRTGLLAVRQPQSVWAAEWTPVFHWAAGCAVQPWESNCPGFDGSGSWWETGSRQSQWPADPGTQMQSLG